MGVKRFRRIRKWGGMLVIPLSQHDVQDYGIIPGDFADISDINIVSEQLMKLKREEEVEKDGD